MNLIKNLRRHRLLKDFDNLFPVIVFGIFLGVMMIFYYKGQNELKKNGIILNGKILSCLTHSKSAVIDFKYEFNFDGKRYISNCSAGVVNPKDFIGKVFPVIFSPKSKRNRILVSPIYFKKFGVEFPDSLDWVRPFAIKRFDLR